jgi:uncharacterized protein (DUF169 family)
MDDALIRQFLHEWQKYFPGADLPITFEIGGKTEDATMAPSPKCWRCLICELRKVRNGSSLVFDASTIACSGGKVSLGYETKRGPEFRYFLSTGKEGVVKGERYKKTPEIVDEWTRQAEHVASVGKTITFRRWDKLSGNDNPDAVIFYARPEVLSGLFTLANFDQSDPNGGVIAPFGAGCSSIIHHPWLEQQKAEPRAVLGMFDPSARPCVPVDVLTMTFPMKKFEKVVGYMEESFLVTETWSKVMRKIERSNTIFSG